MNRLTALIVFWGAAVAVSAMTGCSRPEEPQNGTAASLYEVSAPSGWQVLRPPGVTLLVSPPADKEDSFREMISIGLLSRHEPRAGDAVDLLTQTLQQKSINFQQLRRGQATIDGREAQFVDYTLLQGSMPVRERAYVVPGNHHTFVLTLTTTVATFDERLPDMQRVLGGFRIRD